MTVEFNRNQTLNLINRNPVLATVYLGYCREMCDPNKKFDQDGVDRAIRRIFDERIADPISFKLYQSEWEGCNPIVWKYEYVEVPKYDEMTNHIQRLVNIHGWRGVMLAFRRYANIKEAEMQNGGFLSQREQWAKMGESFRKFGSPGIMT